MRASAGGGGGVKQPFHFENFRACCGISSISLKQYSCQYKTQIVKKKKIASALRNTRVLLTCTQSHKIHNTVNAL